MAELTEKIGCRSPHPDRHGVTNIPAWKFDLLRSVILKELGGQEMTARALNTAVKARMDPADLARLGSFTWHITTVRLEMEARGEIARIPGVSPLRLRAEQTRPKPMRTA